MIDAICARFAAPEGEAWGTLLPMEIASRCRARAEAAIARAEGYPPELSIAYFEVAEAWIQLADEVEWAAQKTAHVRTRTAIPA